MAAAPRASPPRPPADYAVWPIAHAFVRHAFTVAATGRDVAMNVHHFPRFRDGRMRHVRVCEDRALVAAALGA